VFHAAVGVLIGGAWSWWLKKAREERVPSTESEDRDRAGW
jgi:membrane protein YqaA with SNARE-associated domain